MKKIETKDAPKALGPYSQGIICPPNASLIFVAGQLPIDPKTNELIEGDIQAMTRRILENLKAILVAAGSSFEKVVRVEVFLKDLKNFAAMNEEYSRHFTHSSPPARQTVQIADLPKG